MVTHLSAPKWPDERPLAPVWLACLVLAVLILLPRLWDIDRFIAADERPILNSAIQFLEGLMSGDLRLTLGMGYPDMPLAWAHGAALALEFVLARQGWVPGFPSGLSLDQFLAGWHIQPRPYYVAARIATIVLVAVLLELIYLFGRRVYGDRVALAATLLLTFDATLLGYGRLVHMAVPLALLMFLTVTVWLLWLVQRRRLWLVLSGVFCGLSISTVTIALVLLPALALLALLFWWTERPHAPAFRRWIVPTAGQWLVSVLVAAVTFALIWPAMWVDPLGAVVWAFDWLWKNMPPGSGNLGMYWMGQTVFDPGPGFYPLALLVRISPLMLIGVLAGLLTLRCATHRRLEWSLWAYIVFYLVVMTFAEKKSVRYALMPLVALAPLAAWGLLRAADGLAGHIAALTRPRLALLGGILLLAGTLPYAPYYLSYYNPLLLGWLWVPRVMHIAWGEGMDRAAEYLNTKPDADQLRVAAWYEWTFAPYFKGRTLLFTTENVLQADYAVFYVNQVQRNIPDPNLIAYFQRRIPEHVVHINGVAYAWIYPAVIVRGGLPEGVTPLGVRMGDAVVLEGYAVRPAADHPHALDVALYWRMLRNDLPEHFVYVRAVDGAGNIYARTDAPPVMGFLPTHRWKAGQLIEDVQRLIRPEETPPGRYQLEVGMYDPQSWAVLPPAQGVRGGGGGLILGEVGLP
ncbi:MAG: ArnT family glycosyltransferase [Anaerolineae bacterium]